MTTPKHNDKPGTTRGATPQDRIAAGGDERESNLQRGLAVDQKPGSADAGVHGGNRQADLTQAGQRQKQELQGRSDRQRDPTGTTRDPLDPPEC